MFGKKLRLRRRALARKGAHYQALVGKNQKVITQKGRKTLIPAAIDEEHIQALRELVNFDEMAKQYLVPLQQKENAASKQSWSDNCTICDYGQGHLGIECPHVST